MLVVSLHHFLCSEALALLHVFIIVRGSLVYQKGIHCLLGDVARNNILSYLGRLFLQPSHCEKVTLLCTQGRDSSVISEGIPLSLCPFSFLTLSEESCTHFQRRTSQFRAHQAASLLVFLPSGVASVSSFVVAY